MTTVVSVQREIINDNGSECPKNIINDNGSECPKKNN
jgi:hypothetical protein